MLLDENIYVINGAATYFIGIVTFISYFLSWNFNFFLFLMFEVDDAIENCCVDDGAYDSTISGWENEINYIDSQASKYSDEIRDKVNDIVSQARDLLTLLQVNTNLLSQKE